MASGGTRSRSPSAMSQAAALQDIRPPRKLYFHLEQEQEIKLTESTHPPDPNQMYYYEATCTERSKPKSEPCIASEKKKGIEGDLRKYLNEAIKMPSVVELRLQARFGKFYFILPRQDVSERQRIDDLMDRKREFLFKVQFDKQKFEHFRSVYLEDTPVCLNTFKIKFTAYSDDRRHCIEAGSSVHKKDDGTFVHTTHVKTPQSRPKLDIVRPGKSGDIRIVSLLQSEPVDSTDYVSEIATKITDTMTENIRADGKLSTSMQIAGQNFCVDFVRKKTRTIYKWKKNTECTVTHCTAYNCSNFNRDFVRERRRNKNYEPFLVEFEDSPVEEIYFTGANHHVEDPSVSSRSVDDLLSEFDGFIEASFCIADMV